MMNFILKIQNNKINKIEENKFPENPEKFIEISNSKMSDLEIKKYFQQSGFKKI